MAGVNPTLVTASLDDTQLRESISNLVSTVKTKTQQMANDFDSAIERMNASLKKLGSGTSVSVSGSSDASSVKQDTQAVEENTAARKKNTQAAKEQKMTLDQMAQAQQQATAPKSARDSFYAFAKGFKQQAQEISQYIQSFERGLNAAISNRTRELTAQLNQSKERVRQLNEELNRVHYASGNPQATAQIQAQLDRELRTHNQIENAIKNVNQEFAFERTYLASLYAEHHKISNMLRDESMLVKNKVENANNAVTAERRVTEEIQKQARAIRESQQWKEKGFASVGNTIYYDPERSTLPKKDRLSLEEQILKTVQEQNTAEQQVTAAENATTEAAREEARIREMMRQGVVTTNEALEKARSLSNKGFGVTIGDKDGTVNTFTTKLESAKRLSEELKKLKTQYENLDFGQRQGVDAQNIAIKIREITRQAQILSRELNTPTKKEIAGLSEKNLDDISYKMKQLQAYRQGIDLTKPNAAAEIKQVDDELQRLQRNADKWMSKQKSMIEGNNALGRSWNYMKNRLAFYFTVGASTQFVRQLIEVRSQYEMNERALGILIDSAEKGTQIFKELSQMSLVSPYTLIELSTAAKQLTAYDIAAKDVVDTTRRLADMAAAVGIPIERLTYALGQIKAYGYLNSRDARMFSNAGIPLVKQMADYYSQLEGQLVSTADVYDRIKKKQIDFEEVVAVINHMTDEGGKFFDFQAKMADTLKVQLANLTLAWNNMLNDIGSDNQGVLSGGIKMLKEMFLRWRDIERVMTDVAIAFGLLKAAQLLSTVMFGKGTLAAIRNAAAMKGVTAENYTSILSTKKLTAEQAKLLVAMNKGNAGLITAVSRLKVLSTAEINAANNANILKTAWIGVRAAMATAEAGIAALSATLAAVAPQLAIFAAIGAIVDFGQMLKDRYDKIKEFNDNLVRNTKESTESISKYLENITYGDATKLAAEEQEKAWERVREEIEMSTAAAERYISELEKEPNVGKRINSANEVLRKVAEIHGMMSEWHKDDIKITQDFKVLGIGADGLSTDLEDFLDAYHTAIQNSTEDIELNTDATNSLGESWERVMRFVSQWGEFFMHGMNIPVVEEISEALAAIHPMAWLQKWVFGGDTVFGKLDGILRNEAASAQIELNELNDEVEELADSLVKKLKKEGVSDPLKIREALEKTLKSAGYTGEQLETVTILATRKMRDEYHKLYSNVPREFDKALSSESASVEAFFNFVKNRNSQLLSNIAREDLQNGKWLTKERQKELDKYLMEFRKTHALAFEDLKQYVGKANNLSIYIPVYFNVAKTPEEVAKDFMERTGYLQGHKYYSEFVKDSASQVDIINKVKKAQKEKQKQLDAAEKAGGKYWKNNKDRLTQENNELITIIHSYNALTDEEEKRKEKKGKDLVLEALKQEIGLVEKLRSDYDKLTKSGATQAEALYTVRSAYGKTINQLNANLKGFGLPQINLNKLIVGKDPNKQLEHYRKTLEALTKRGLLNVDRAKEVEAVIEKLTVSAKTYNFDKITKSLNSELGKLKEEYELAVELDANPELGGLFADWMGISMEDLPRTVEEVTKRAQNIVDKAIGELNKKWIDAGATISNTLKGNADIMFSHIIEEEKLIEKGWDGINNKLSSINTKEYTIKDVSGKERTITVTPVLPNGEILTPKELDDYVQKTIEGSLIDKNEIIQTVGIKLTDDANVESLIEKIKSEVNNIPKEKIVEILTSYETKKPDTKVLEKSIRRMMDYKMPAAPSVETDDNMKQYTKDLETYENKVKAVTDTIYQWIEAQHKARLQGALVTVVENSTTTTNKTDNVTEETLLLNGFTEEEIQRLKKGKIAISDVAKAMRIVGEHKDFDETKRSVVNLLHAFGDTKNVDELNNKLLLMQDFLLSMQGEKVVVETDSKKNIVNVSEKREVNKNITDNIQEETLKVHGLTDNDIKNLKQGKIAIEDVEGALNKGKQLFDDYSKGVLTFEELTAEIKKMAVLTDGIDFGSEDSINEYTKKLTTIYHYLVEINDVANNEISITVNNRDALEKVGEVLSKLNGVNDESQINIRLNVNDNELDALRNAFINDESVNIRTTSLKDDTGFQQIVIDVDNKEALQRVNEIVKKVVDLRNYTNLNISMNVDDAQLEDIKQLIPTSESINFDVDANVSNSVEEILSLDKKKIVVDVDADAKSKNVLQEIANLYAKAKEGGFIPSTKIDDIMNIDLEKWAESNNIEIDAKTLEAFKKVQSQLRDIRKKEIQETSSNWNKLLEKYSEYEYKLNQIAKTANKERLDFIKKMGTDEQKVQATTLVTKIDAEKDPSKKEELTNQLKQITTEIAGSDAAKIQITTAIDTRELQESARLSFEEFQKTPEWITATGNLADMSTDAIKSLIDSINDYKENAKNLSPKQIKQMNQALKQLHAEQRKNNPFKAIITMIDESKERMANFDNEIRETETEIAKLRKKKKENIVDGIVDEETDKKLKNAIERLEELRKKREEAGEIDATSWVSAINETISAIGSAVGVFNDLAKAIDGVENSDFDKTMNVLTQAGNAAATGAMIGGTWGAVIGGVVGAATSVIGMISESGNEAINAQIKSSELAVKRLEYAYIDLERTINKAYGTGINEAKQAAAAAKKLELYELERQLRLEKSRDSKHRDEDRIIELQKQIKELKYEIEDMYREIVDDILGSDVGSFAENLVSTMADAFKQGEDYMKTYEETFDKMIDNMIMKSITSRIVSSYLDKMWESLDARLQTRAKDEADAYAKAQAEQEKLKDMDYKSWMEYDSGRKGLWAYIYTAEKYGSEEERAKAYLKRTELAEREVEKTKAALDAASEITDNDIDWLMNYVDGFKGELGEKLKEAFSKYWTFGQDSDKTLSALQQGIQGITEDTAGAIEAYLNGVSQQVYLHSDLLTQIRDAVVGFDFDVQVATMSQILLQLQSSYQVQLSIKSTLDGWSNASGQAVRVEMI